MLYAYLFADVFACRKHRFRLSKICDDPVFLKLPVGEAQVEPAASCIKRDGADGAGGAAVFVHEAPLEGHAAEGRGHGI